MKNIVFALAALLSATAFAAHPTGDYMTWFGSDAAKDVTYSSGSSFYGAWSGEGGQYLNYSGFFGALSGYRAYDVNRSLGFGSWALRDCYKVAYTVAIGTSAGRGANAVDNCVFIGTNAGRDVYGCTNCVFIGKDAGHMRSGVIDETDINGHFVVVSNDTSKQCFIGPNKMSGYTLNRPNIVLTDEILMNGSRNTAVSIQADDLYFTGRATLSEDVEFNGFVNLYNNVYMRPENMFFFHDSGMVCGLENEVKRIVGSKSLTIEDEDTGEKYIIKVKSGALKLYKVSEDSANGPLNNAPNGNGGSTEQE